MNFLIIENNDYNPEALDIYKNIGHIFTFEKYDPKVIDVLIVRLSQFLDESFLTKFINLKYIISPTTSLTHIDIKYIKTKNIQIISLRNCKEKLEIITSSAEHALTLALSLERNLHNYLKEKIEDWDRYKYPIREISSLKVGIIGYGRIGKWLMKVFNLISSEVFFYDKDEQYKSFSRFREKRDLFIECDILLICASYNKGDNPLITFQDFQSIKNGINIVNIARAGLVDEEAIVYGLKKGFISGYATDVLVEEKDKKPIKESKLIELKSQGYNILITPHIGGAASDAIKKTELILADYFQKLIQKKV